MTPPRRELVVDAGAAGLRLDQFLAQSELPFSRSQLKRRIEQGQVRIGGRPAKASVKVRAGDRIAIELPPPAPSTLEPEAIPLRVLYEDEHLIAIDKPAGLVVHPAAGHATGTLVHALLAHCTDLGDIGGQVRPGIVHRLDKETSGVLVVAKSARVLEALQLYFRHRTLEREYWALVAPAPTPAQGEIRTLYGRDPRDRKRFSSRVATGRTAITRYATLERFLDGGAALVVARLETGRTHQIRVHFRDRGFPVLGDPVYGRTPRTPLLRAVAADLGRQALHARTLAFEHPVTAEPLRLEAEPPADFQAALSRLRALSDLG